MKVLYQCSHTVTLAPSSAPSSPLIWCTNLASADYRSQLCTHFCWSDYGGLTGVHIYSSLTFIQVYIGLSTSPALSDFFFCVKKEGSSCPCIERRGFIQISVKYADLLFLDLPSACSSSLIFAKLTTWVECTPDQPLFIPVPSNTYLLPRTK